jgi:hypothetical protein
MHNQALARDIVLKLGTHWEAMKVFGRHMMMSILGLAKYEHSKVRVFSPGMSN